jgi:GNAT superfamily N-acetyltransferase
MFYVERIEYERLDELIDILIERCCWLKENAKDMWNVEELNTESIIKKYVCPKCYLGFEDGEKIGGFLLIEKDKRYWPDRIEDKAYYIHKFVVKPEYSKKRYSHKMLEWIKELGIKNDKKYIRLDYEKHRSYLRNMYLDHGFQDIELIIKNDGTEIVKAEFKIKS